MTKKETVFSWHCPKCNGSVPHYINENGEMVCKDCGYKR